MMKVTTHEENMTKPCAQKTNTYQSVPQNVQIDGLEEVDALLRECTKRIELGSSLVPELEDMVRHGE